MVIQLLHPQEIETYYVIPAIRMYFARFMKEKGKGRKEIAKILQVRESTISHYNTSKRASSIKFSKEIEEMIQKSALKMNTVLDTLRETQKILLELRKNDELCEIHRLHCSHLSEDCQGCENLMTCEGSK
jgi:predicted transcriptional regulator